MGAKRNGASIRRRILARRLRELREQAGFTLEEAAPPLDTSMSRLSRIESGQQKADVHLVKSMLDLFDVGGGQWAELVELARETAKPAWYRAYGLVDNSYVGYETEATQVQEYATGFVPGLLQVPDYSRVLFESGLYLPTPELREAAFQVRRARQERLQSDENPLRLVAIVDEAVLRNPIAGMATQRSQLDHLVTAAALPTVTLQVLTTATGAHPALGSGFVVLSFGDLGEPDMAYIEHALGYTHFEKGAAVARARLVFDQLRSIALPPAESVGLIKQVADQL
jgi:transcriptional regulator with XRE-family HTH domain